MSRSITTSRTAATSRITRHNWRQVQGGLTSGDSAVLRRMTMLELLGVRPRFDPTGTGLFVYDYPTGSGVYEVRLADAFTGKIVQEVTLGDSAIPHYMNGNACFSPNGQFVIVQVQAGITPYIAAGQWHPGYGFECDFWAKHLATGVWTQLTTHTLGTLGQTVTAWVNGMFTVDGLKFIVTNRYADNPITEGHGMWRLRIYDWAVAGTTPSLTGGTVVFTANDPALRPLAYYVTAMGQFGASHPSFAGQVLVGGNLDGQNFVNCKHYAVNLTTGSVTGPIGNVGEDAWEEDAAINPRTGQWVNVSNGESIYTITPGTDWPTKPITREFYLAAADGESTTRLTGFNLPASVDRTGDRAFCHIAAGGWSPDGTMLLAALLIDSGSETLRSVTQTSIIRLVF